MKFVFALLTFVLSLKAAAEPMLRVRPHVVVAPDAEVTLKQIVDTHEISEATLLKLGKVSVAKAPALGEHVQLTNTTLMQLLRPLVQEERQLVNRQVTLSVPKDVTIDTQKRDITADAITAELLQAWQPLCGDCKLEVEGLSLPKVGGIRDWTLKVKSEIPRGSFSIPVELIRETGSTTSAWVSGRLINKKSVPVAKRALQIGERVQESDFSWEYRDTSFAIDGTPISSELIGKQVKQGLRAGDVVWIGSLQKEKAIQRGDVVQVRSKADDWEVSLTVIADRDAFIGDTISLKNPKTNSTVVGQVTARGEVELK